MSTNSKSTSTRPKSRSAKSNTGKRSSGFALPHIEFSKFCVGYVLVLVTSFLIFVCYEIHRQSDLSAVGYMAGGVLVCLGIVILAYMKRAYHKDLTDLEIDKTKKLSAIKKKAGDDFVYEPINDVDLTA